jgi:hypothetical protein
MPVWRRSASPAPDAPPPGIDFGWRVHLAIQEWTKSVDQKASIILVFSVALATLAGHEVFDASGGLHDVSGLRLLTVRAMGIAFATSAALAISVVLPHLRRRKARREAPSGLVFFGHLQHRTATDIERQLRMLDHDEALGQLARQLKATSAIAWRKHARLQLAMFALLIASALFGIARLAM